MTQAKQMLYTPVDVDDADFVDFETDPKMESENAEFEQFKTEMHDAQLDAKITVGKKLTDSNGRPLGRQVFECFECGIDDYTFSQLCTRIREDFGTGLYKIQGRDSKGKFKFNKTVGILAPNQTDNAPAGNDIGQLIDKFSDAMSRQQMQTEAMFSKLAGPQTGGDAFDQMTKMMTAMGTMMGSMGMTPQQPKGLLDQLTEFKMLKELFGEGEGGGDANLYSLLTATMQSFGGPIAAAIAAGQTTGEVNAAGILDNPIPKLEGETMEAKETEALKKQILVILGNAKAGVDPKSFANIVVQNTPENMVDKLYEFLIGDDWFTQICFLNPECKTHENWFTAWRDTVIELLTEPADEPIVASVDIPQSESDHPTETVAATGPDIADNSDGDAGKDT